MVRDIDVALNSDHRCVRPLFKIRQHQYRTPPAATASHTDLSEHHGVCGHKIGRKKHAEDTTSSSPDSSPGRLNCV